MKVTKISLTSALLFSAVLAACGDDDPAATVDAGTQQPDGNVLVDASTADATLEADAAPACAATVCEVDGDPCRVGRLDCSTTPATCELLYLRPAGTACGTDLVCDPFGECVAASDIAIADAPERTVDEKVGATTFTLVLPGTPSADITVTVTTNDDDTCVVADGDSTITLTAADYLMSREVEIEVVNDDELTGGFRECVVTFTTAAGSLTRTLNVEDTEVIWVSRNRTTTEWRDSSYSASFDPSGEYVVFTTSNKLVAGDDNENQDIYEYKRSTDSLRVFSRNTSGDAGNGQSYFNSDRHAIGADGYVAFLSHASDLVSSDPNGSERDFYLQRLGSTDAPIRIELGNSRDRYDLFMGEEVQKAFYGRYDSLGGSPYTRVSSLDIETRTETLLAYRTSDELLPPDNDTYLRGVSPNGRFILFDYYGEGITPERTFSHLDAEECSGCWHGAVRDLETGETVKFDRSGDTWSYSRLTNAGEVVFVSRDAWVEEDTNNTYDIYILTPFGDDAGVRPALEGVERFRSPLASVGSDGLNDAVFFHNGRFLAFSTNDAAFVDDARKASGGNNWVILDRETGASVVRSFRRYGYVSGISADGHVLAIQTGDALDPRDTNRNDDVYLMPGL